MEQQQISALINLLDDPDEGVFFQVRGELLSIGVDIIPTLESAWEQNLFGLDFQDRIEQIIHDIQFQCVKDRMSEWGQQPQPDLLEGAILVAKYQYPDMNEDAVRDKIKQIRNDIWLELNDNLTAFETVKVLNQILFTHHGFSGNKKNYHAPQNSYINNVLETRKGNPLLLSIIYMSVSQNLSLPIYGVNLPNHFVLAYMDKFKDDRTSANAVLFYINAFSRGFIFNRAEIQAFVKQLNLEAKEEFFAPCDNVTIIRRLINNLVFSYDKLGYLDKVSELKDLRLALSPI